MYFCINSKCLFHVDVAREKYVHTITLPEPVRPISEPMPTHVTTLTREKHLWVNTRGFEWFFCDVCREAAKIVKEGE